jgi:hypothetical protein
MRHVAGLKISVLILRMFVKHVMIETVMVPMGTRTVVHLKNSVRLAVMT